MFKKFVERIMQSERPVQEVFYGEDGIDRAYQKELIDFREHQLLLALCDRLEGR